MLNNLIGILLGCIHEYVQPDYIPLVDAVFVPSATDVILITCCVLTARTLSAFAKVVTASSSK